MLFFIASLAAPLLIAAAQPVLSAPSRPSSHVARSGIQWSECGLSSTSDFNTTVPILCGTLAVPKDYSDSKNNATIDLPLLRIAATKNSTTTRRSVLLNYGGPGINGTTSFEILGARQQAILGPEFDLITWYPRGTNGGLLFSCFQNDTTRNAFYAANPTIFGNASDVAQGQLWANSQTLGETCTDVSNTTGNLIGTAFSARDAMQIVDALNEDGLIRYWGISYGTVLGSTIAALFPDRIDKLLIDGVVNVQEYYHGVVLSSRESSGDVLMGFAKDCVNNTAQCPLAQNRTATQVYNAVLGLMDEVKASPAVFSSPLSLGGPYQVSYTYLKSTIYSFLYSPSAWTQLSTLVDAVMTRNSTAILDYFLESSGNPPETDGESLQGIECGDTSARVDTLREAQSMLKPFQNNPFSDVDDPIGLACARWPFAAKERYSGSWDITTNKPLMVIGNTWDPATPLASAKNVSAGFKNSVLLEQRGYGHGSTAQASLCTFRRVRDYFTTGTLPKVGTVCKVDSIPFSTESDSSFWATALKDLAAGQNGTVVSS